MSKTTTFTKWMVTIWYTNVEIRDTEGVVAVYIRDCLKYKVCEDLSLFQTGEFESIFVEFFSDHKSIIVGEIYRVPNTDENTSLQRYEAVIYKIKKLNKDTIIGTDQNFDYLMLESHTSTTALLDTFISHGLAPCITRPTRVTHNTATLIDNIYLSANYCNNCSSGIIISDISSFYLCWQL